jgi:hypothetical protein
VLLGTRKSDRPIVRAAEVGVQEAVQFDGRALKSGCAPCEAPPRHSVVFLFHRFWFFLILASDHQDRLDEPASLAIARAACSKPLKAWQPPCHGARLDEQAHAIEGRSVSPQHEKRHGIGRDSLTLFECSLGIRVIDHSPRAKKNPPTLIRRRKVPWRFFVREIALPHIDPCGSRHLAVSNDRLPDSVYRIAPDAQKQG